MKKSRYTEAQFFQILEQAEAGVPVREQLESLINGVPSRGHGNLKYGAAEGTDKSYWKYLRDHRGVSESRLEFSSLDRLPEPLSSIAAHADAVRRGTPAEYIPNTTHAGLLRVFFRYTLLAAAFA